MTGQTVKGVAIEYLSHETHSPMDSKLATVAGHDPGTFLTAMLE